MYIPSPSQHFEKTSSGCSTNELQRQLLEKGPFQQWHLGWEYHVRCSYVDLFNARWRPLHFSIYFNIFPFQLPLCLPVSYDLFPFLSLLMCVWFQPQQNRQLSRPSQKQNSELLNPLSNWTFHIITPVQLIFVEGITTTNTVESTKMQRIKLLPLGDQFIKCYWFFFFCRRQDLHNWSQFF